MNSPNAIAARLILFSPLALAVAGCRSHDFPQYPPNYREYAYVTNGGSGTVSVYDVVNVRHDREIAVGQNPVAVAASPLRNEVYVVNSGSAAGVGSISVIHTEDNTVAATIAARRQPVAIEIDPTGALAYVANSSSNTVSILDLKARSSIAELAVGAEPVALRVAPDDKTLVVANRKAGSVNIFGLGIPPVAPRLRQSFDGCPGASDVAILPDSSKAFIACSAGHQIMVLRLARAEAHPVGAAASAAQPDKLEALLDVGQTPSQLALKPDGGELFALNSLSNSISEIVTGTNDVGGSYMIGDDPVRGLVSADNALLYVANLQSQYVTVYSIDDGRRAGSIQVGDGPTALGLSNSGLLLFVVDARSGDVSVVRTASRSLFTLLPAGRAPNAIALKAFKLP
ncbi:MAG: hypothetical protein ABR907_13450 [Terracidiphilus sp.]|jgi:YVTN family beta-propeller protein